MPENRPATKPTRHAEVLGQLAATVVVLALLAVVVAATYAAIASLLSS